MLLFAALITVGGAISIATIPLDALPDLSDVQVIVRTELPGQAPSVVEDQVTYPLSRVLLSVPGAVTVRSYSFVGDSFVYVLFEEGTDIYWARSRVQEYLSQAIDSLPEGARPQLGPDASGVGWIFQYALVDRTGTHDLADLRSIQDWFLRFELQTVAGVAEVATVGGMVRQYQVVVDPDRLSSLDLSLRDVQRAIAGSNTESGASVIELAEAEYMVRVRGYLDDMEDLQDVPVSVSDSGQPTLLGDVADIRMGPQMRRGVADLDGEGEVVGGIIVMRSGENALQTIAGVKERLDELRAGLPEGVEIETVYDRSQLIERAVDTLNFTLVEELALVALVCALLLFHVRSSLVVVVSLPVAVLAAFIVMRVQGVNANIMSLGGITIAIGAMVDGAIVMVENAARRLQLTQPQTSEERWAVISEAAKEVGEPLFYSLLIITVGFLPVFALQAQEGLLFTPLALTKTYAMAAAAGLTVTLVPVLLGYFFAGTVKEKNNPIDLFLMRVYRPIATWVVRYPWPVVVVAVLISGSAIYPLTRVGTEFLPPLNEGALMYMPSSHPGISIDKARELLQQTDRLIATVPEVEQVFGKIGRAETATDPAPLTMIETLIQLKPTDEWRPGVDLDGIRADLNRVVTIPGLNNTWTMPIKTRTDMLSTGVKSRLGIRISGPELSVIQDIGVLIEAELGSLEGTASVYAERVEGGRYIEIDIDRKSAARYGLNVADLNEVIRAAIGGVDVTYTVEGRERYPVNLRYPQNLRDSVERLELLPVNTETNARVALADVANIRVIEGPPMIKSENARLSGYVYIDIANVDIGTYAERAQSHVRDNVSLPSSYSLEWVGQYEYLVRAEQRLFLIIPLVAVLVMALLVLALKSAVAVFLAVIVTPLSVSTGLWTLYLLEFNMSIAVWIGFIALVGVAVELTVLMLTYLEMAQSREVRERAQTWLQLEASIIMGAVRRIRPIAMTTITVLAGLFPIMISDGTGAEMMQRIAAPMFGGIVGAAVAALLVIPALYVIWQSLSRRIGGKEESFNATATA